MVLLTSLHSTLLLVCLSFFASIAFGAPVQDQEEHLEKRAFYPIAGLKSSGTHPRLEIRQLQKNTAQWNLYLLALNRFKGMSQTDKLSYYQVSGIHGRPFTAWDGVRLDRNGGYCTHGTVLFPTWHRPYLALYEQILYGIVQQIAAEQTVQKATYLAAAKTFRAPYWDWAAPRQNGAVYPSMFKGSVENGVSYMTINMPSGPQKIRNPLYSYSFHPLSASDLPNTPFNVWPTTLRYPTSKAKGATSRNDDVAAQMLRSQPSYSQRFMNILQVLNKFEQFGNSGWIPNSPGSYDSLESLHDQIHGLIGNGGHMAIIDYAAFDPLFWLHHNNVDRLFAIWQAIYPDKWMPAQNKLKFGSAVLLAGQNVDQTTPLKPFHKDSAGNFWTSQSSRYTTSFGYTYPETANNASPASAKRAVNALYGPTSGKTLPVRKRHFNNSLTSTSTEIAASPSQTAFAAAVAAGLDPELASQLASNATSTSSLPSAAMATAASATQAETYKEWITNIRVAKNALQSAFFIHIFLGDFNPDPSCWSFEPNLVGTHAVFTPFANASFALSAASEVIVTGTIPLTRALQLHAQQGLLDDINDVESVESYLRKNLHWRVTRMDDTDVPRREVQELKISVVSCDVQPSGSEEEFPSWGRWSVHRGVTEGREGGLGSGEDS